jgi:hypothetical protein
MTWRKSIIEKLEDDTADTPSKDVFAENELVDDTHLDGLARELITTLSPESWATMAEKDLRSFYPQDVEVQGIIPMQDSYADIKRLLVYNRPEGTEKIVLFRITPYAKDPSWLGYFASGVALIPKPQPQGGTQ